MRSQAERLIGHRGTETKSSIPTGVSIGESLAMDASPTKQYYVKDEGLWVVNFYV